MNIADYWLDVVEDGALLMSMRVVVGRQYRRTPVFSDVMTYLVLNPYWHVPPGIAGQVILPLVREDVGYLADKRISVYRGWEADTKAIDPASIDWSAVDGTRMPYRFRQEPGSGNALGRLKFMFPNKFNVYLHDTPARELIAKQERGFGSGCIRVEDPLELAEFVLQGDPWWTRESLLASLEGEVDRTIHLPAPIPVHILYWTAWADDNGLIHFRDDIYGRDERLEKALEARPPK